MTSLISMAGRIRYVFAVAATLLPVVALMLVFFLSAFEPVFHSMEKIVQTGYQEVRPLHELEVALLGAAVPPHDCLIDGAEDARGSWLQAKIRVRTAFEAARAAVERRDGDLLLGLQLEWAVVESRGDGLFHMTGSAHPTGAVTQMLASFDAALEGLLQRVRFLIAALEQDLHAEYQRMAERKHEGIALAFVILLLSLLSGLAGGAWLSRARRTILDQSLHDPLTGLLNRRALQLEFAKMRALVVGAEDPLGYSVLLLDLDHFKAVNDRYGHDIGDLALKSMARTAGEVIRGRDIFGRYGGEEFVVLLPGIGIEGARILAERIRERIASSPVQLPDGAGQIRLTVSIGGASDAGRAVEVEEVVRQADQAMYEAKRAGRNRVVCRD